MQFFILFVGVMVFVFYQFQRAAAVLQQRRAGAARAAPQAPSRALEAAWDARVRRASAPPSRRCSTRAAGDGRSRSAARRQRRTENARTDDAAKRAR